MRGEAKTGESLGAHQPESLVHMCPSVPCCGDKTLTKSYLGEKRIFFGLHIQISREVRAGSQAGAKAGTVEEAVHFTGSQLAGTGSQLAGLRLAFLS